MLRKQVVAETRCLTIVDLEVLAREMAHDKLNGGDLAVRVVADLRKRDARSHVEPTDELRR